MPSPIYGRMFNDGKKGEVTRQGSKNHPIISRLETWKENVTTALDAEGNFEFFFNPASKYNPGKWVVRGNLGEGTFEVNPDILEALGYVKEEEDPDPYATSAAMTRYAESLEIHERIPTPGIEEDGTKRFGLFDDLRFPLAVKDNDEATWKVKEYLYDHMTNTAFNDFMGNVDFDPEHSCFYAYSDDKDRLETVKMVIVWLAAEAASEVEAGA